MIVLEYIKKAYHKELGKDIFWTLFGQILIMVVLLLMNKALSNLLTVEEFGRYNIVRRSTSVITFVLVGGLGITMPRYLSISIGKKDVRGIQAYLFASWVYLLIIVGCVSLVYLLLYKELATIVLGSNDFDFYVACLLYAVTAAINTYIYAYYRGIGKFKLFNLSQIIAQILLLLPILFQIDNLFYIICSWTLLNIVFIISILVKENRNYHSVMCKFRASVKMDLVKLKEIFVYSFPRLLGDFFLFSYSAFPVIYVGYFLGQDQASYYSVGVSLVSMVTPIFSFLGVVLLPSISKMIAIKQMPVANRLVTRVALVYLCLSLVLTTILYFKMDLLIHLFFADKYLVAGEIGKILALSLLPQSMYLLYRNPNDAASVFPFNTIILAVSFVLLVCGFLMFDTLSQYAYVYLAVAFVQCLLSMIVWYIFSIKKYEV